MDNTRPYVVLAWWGNPEPQWFVRTSHGMYRKWSDPHFIIPPEQLTPVKADFAKFVGDNLAIAEIWAAREAAGKEHHD